MSDNRKLAFIDTNVLIYAYSENDRNKKSVSLTVFNDYRCILSTHVLNEFCNMCIKKLHYPIEKIHKSIDEILNACDLFIVNEKIIHKALDIHDRYQASYYDSVVIASALECKCEFLLSEDLQNGQVIGNTTIKNIYLK